MTIVKIYYLEDNKETDPVSTLEDGEHFVGRGETLKCNDKRVSRKHALINIENDRVSITPVHINPCFFKAANGKSIEILKKDEPLALNDGDNFALLADNYWFRVKILNQSSSDMQFDAIPLSNSCKRSHTHEDNTCESCNKRTKFSQDEIVSINPSVTLPSPKETLNQPSPQEASVNLGDLLSSSSNVNHSHAETKVLLDNLENIINEVGVISSDSEESVVFLETVKLEGDVKPVDEVRDEINITNPGNSGTNIEKPSTRCDDVKPGDEIDTKIKTDVEVKDEINITNPGSSGTNIQQPSTWRDRCWYGSTCYRKNATHRADFSHPGDPDYDDAADTRPDCPYGNECYRTNLDHRKQYKHSSKPAPKPSKIDFRVNFGSCPYCAHCNQMYRKPGYESDPENGPVTPNRYANSIADGSESGSDRSDDTQRNRKITKVKKNYNESPIDDYDYNDPFIDDASSDEFQISTDDDGGSSDWEDSEKVVEDSQETKRLLKEAKRFTRKKKN